MKQDNKKIAKIFKALCDEQRIQIVKKLQSGEMCACNLLECVDVCQSSLSYHMKILVDSGLIKKRQDGKWMYYKISEEGAINALEILKSLTKANNNMKKNDGCCLRSCNEKEC